jgi:hypothetical protein
MVNVNAHASQVQLCGCASLYQCTEGDTVHSQPTSQSTSQAGHENMNSPRQSRIRLSGTGSNPLQLVWLYHHTSIRIAHSYPCISAFDWCTLVQTQRGVGLGQIPSRTPPPQFALAPNQLMQALAQLAQSLQCTRNLPPLKNASSGGPERRWTTDSSLSRLPSGTASESS